MPAVLQGYHRVAGVVEPFAFNEPRIASSWIAQRRQSPIVRARRVCGTADWRENRYDGDPVSPEGTYLSSLPGMKNISGRMM
jgi:hypothetical protein